MGRKLPQTPRSIIKHGLRLIWLRSRERNAALKRDNRTCQSCLKKASTAKGKEFKVQVHHMEGILNWEKLVDAVYEFLLCDPKYLQTLCKTCHDEEHKNVVKLKVRRPIKLKVRRTIRLKVRRL